MKTILRTTVAAAAAALLLACQTTGAPIYNVTDEAVAMPSGKHLSAGQVRTGIMTAGTALGWRIADAGPGRLEGTLHLREHTAVVDIPYSASKYSILYKSSEKLDATGGTIHRNYNGWVQNLDRQIRAELSRM